MNTTAQLVNLMNNETSSNPPIAYSAIDTWHLLKSLRDLMPNATSIRTDKIKPEPVSDDNPVRVVLEFGTKNTIKINLPKEKSCVDKVEIAKQLRLGPVETQLVVDCLTKLATNNSLGAWSLAATQVEPLLLSMSAVGGRQHSPHSYLSETCHVLGDDLQNVGEIFIDYHITHLGHAKFGQNRRRSFLRFIAPDGVSEVAALDASGFALHARHQLLQPRNDPMLDLNLSRMDHWSKQLDVSAEVLAETFGTLTFLTSALHITRIQLR